MKIIFLDIDGVLNVIGQGRDEFGQLFHKHFEDNLKYIIDSTNAKIVISSSWRCSGLKVMQDMWKKRNLAGEVIGITPYVNVNNSLAFNERTERGLEIQSHIDDNNIVDYVILDDDSDMLPHQMNRFVRCSNNLDHEDCIDIGYGLTRKCAELAIYILNK